MTKSNGYDFDWIFMCLKEKLYLENVFVILILGILTPK